MCCRRCVFLLVVFGLAAVAGDGLAAPLGTAFTYQGQLKKDGGPCPGPVDLQFGLFDASSGGNVIGMLLQTDNVSLSNGQFTVPLDFGAGALDGNERWLQINVRCPTGSGGFTALSPRQKLTAAPYAVHAKTSAALMLPYDATLASPGVGFRITNTGPSLVGISTGGDGVVGSSSTSGGNGVHGYATGNAWWGVNGESEQGVGVAGYSYAAGSGGYFAIINPSNMRNALSAYTNGGGSALQTSTDGSGSAAYFIISNPDNTSPSLYATTNGTGPAIRADGLVESTKDGFRFPNGTIQTTAAVAAAPAWSLTGNAGTTPGTNFLGTTDNQPLELKVNDARVLRVDPVSGTQASGGPCATAGRFGGNWIAGYHLNGVSDCGVVGATIAGGGGFLDIGIGSQYESPNVVTAPFGTIGGGWGNQASWFATVSGGQHSSASGPGSVIGGGFVNTASGLDATVPGGNGNQAGGSSSFAAGYHAKVRDELDVDGPDGDPDGDEGTFVWSDVTGSPGYFTSTGPNQFLIKATGGVGIGTNSPEAGLSVNTTLKVDQANTNAGTSDILFGAGATGEGIGSKRTPGGNTNGLDFYTLWTSRLSIMNGGNVGIGVSEPTAKLHVAGTPGVDGVRFPDDTLQTTAARTIIAANVSVDPPSLASLSNGIANVTVAGAAVGDAVVATPGDDLLPGYMVASARVNSANHVRIRFINVAAAAQDPAASTWSIRVIK